MASHDPKAQAALHAADGVWISPATGQAVGRAAIERNYRYWFEAFPDLAMDLDEMLIDGDWATGFWRLRGRQEGPFFGLEGSAGASTNGWPSSTGSRMPASRTSSRSTTSRAC